MARVEGFRNQGIRACHTIQETYFQVLRKIDHAQEISLSVHMVLISLVMPILKNVSGQ